MCGIEVLQSTIEKAFCCGRLSFGGGEAGEHSVPPLAHKVSMALRPPTSEWRPISMPSALAKLRRFKQTRKYAGQRLGELEIFRLWRPSLCSTRLQTHISSL